MMIHIEGDDNINILNDEDDDEEDNGDRQSDNVARKFLDELKKIGPFSKQILNYSYPPLLYQRGDDEEDEEDDDEDGNHGGHNEGLPDFGDQFDDDDDNDIQELIKGSNGLKNEDLYQKLKKVVQDKEAKQYVEEVDEDGNVYLVEASGDEEDYGDEYEEEGGHQIIDGGDLDDEEFLAMMEQEAAEGRLRVEQQNSTIINSS